MSEDTIARLDPVVQVTSQYQIVSEKNETVGNAVVTFRNGVHWVANLWVDSEYRKKGYATRIIKRVLEDFSDRDLYLSVHPFTDQPMSEGELADWFKALGFQPGLAPGIMFRKGVGVDDADKILQQWRDSSG